MIQETTTISKLNIDELLKFLPLFKEPNYEPIKKCYGGRTDDNGTLLMPYHIYEDKVEEFFDTVSTSIFLDYNYDPEECSKMINDDVIIANANMYEIQTMLTYCMRSERFCDGLWGSLISDGTIVKILM